MTFCLACSSSCSSSFSRCSSCCSPNESICTKCYRSGAVLVHNLATVDVTCMASGLLSMLASPALRFFFYAVNDHRGTQNFRLGSFNVSFKARQHEQSDLQLPVRRGLLLLNVSRSGHRSRHAQVNLRKLRACLCLMYSITLVSCKALACPAVLR
jgi:hypothetical protein